MSIRTQQKKAPPKQHRIIIPTHIGILIIVGLLLFAMAIAAPKGFRYTGGESKENAARTDISMFETALDAFFVDTGRYPTTTEGLNVLITNPNLQNWKGPYIKKIPKDPWGNEYHYQFPGKPPANCFLSSNGPDKLPNTPDDITNLSSQP